MERNCTQRCRSVQSRASIEDSDVAVMGDGRLNEMENFSPSSAGQPLGPAVGLPRARASGSAVLACTLSALVGGALVIVTFYPGLMNVDACIQLGEARSQVYSDWHPPL